jgi:hypothetical protein
MNVIKEFVVVDNLVTVTFSDNSAVCMSAELMKKVLQDYMKLEMKGGGVTYTFDE